MTLVWFLLCAAATWWAGIWLTRATDAVDARFKLGSAFGGLLVLGITTSLPEIAIVVTAALQGHPALIIGTLLGGIAIQTVVIALLDAAAPVPRPLTFAAASLTLVLEAAVVIMVTAAALLASQTPLIVPGTALSVSSVGILGIWLAGLWLAWRSRTHLPWKSEALDATPGRAHHERRAVVNHASFRQASTATILGVLGLASGVTLVAGYGLATFGSTLAQEWGINAGFFGATFIALTGALPNISTGLASVKLGDYQLAMSDIFGGNAALPALFVLADLLTGRVILSQLSTTDAWFAALGILLTSIYLITLVVRPRHEYFRLGPDSLLVIALYGIGVAAIFALGS